MRTSAEKYITGLISQGEHRSQDFKFEISDARKIARTLSAFSNTSGGKLLIGVKDNGRIAGVRSEEEYYMLESAAVVFCRPAVKFRVKHWQVEGKTVLETDVPHAPAKPVFALGENGKWLAYIRQDDENILASIIHLKVWEKTSGKSGIFIEYRETEEWLLKYLAGHSTISLKDFIRLSGTSRNKAVETAARLVSVKALKMIYDGKQPVFTLG